MRIVLQLCYATVTLFSRNIVKLYFKDYFQYNGFFYLISGSQFVFFYITSFHDNDVQLFSTTEDKSQLWGKDL
jgi:hypothetical protein